MALALLLRPRPVATEAVGSARAFESVPSRASPLRVAGQERWCLGAGTLPCKKAAPARTSLRPSVCVCLSARAAPGGPGVLGRDTMITGLRHRSHKTYHSARPIDPIRAQPSGTRGGSGARPQTTTAIDRSVPGWSSPCPVAVVGDLQPAKRWGLFPSSLFGSVWRPASHRWHAGSTQVQCSHVCAWSHSVFTLNIAGLSSAH